MTDFLDRQKAVAFMPLLAADELRGAQERLLSALLRRPSLVPLIARSGISRHHFPLDLQLVFVTAKTRTQLEIREVVLNHSDTEIARTYRKGIDLNDADALQLARKIVVSLVPEQVNHVSAEPDWDAINAETRADHLRAARERSANRKVLAVSTNVSKTGAVPLAADHHADDAAERRVDKTQPVKTVVALNRAESAGYGARGGPANGKGAPAYANRGSTDEGKERLKSGLWITCAADVTPKRVDAIWGHTKGGVRLARGEHTMIAGEPGLGKSQITIAMAAAVSNGSDWPCGEGRAPVGNVIILGAEDSIEHTIVPRLIAAGAHLNRVHFVEAAAAGDGKGRRTFNFQTDFAKLKALVEDTEDPVLVIIDPLTAYMGKVDSHKNAEVRAVLAPLGELARECNVAIASITHFTKGASSASTKAISRIIGSVAFIAAPRIGFTVVADPMDQQRRLLLHVKNNISTPPQGLAFRVEQHVIGSDDQGDFLGSSIAWESEPVEGTADEMLGTHSTEPTAKADAVEFLRAVLADGPMKASDIEKEAQAACLLGENQSISQSKPFRSARAELSIEPYQPKGQKAGGWFWGLPGHQMPSEASDALQNKRAPDGEEGT